MAVVLMIPKIYILAACLKAVSGDAPLKSGHIGYDQAYVRVTYPTHPDVKLELYQKARIDKNGGPVLPKPIAFRQPSFVITSFRADLQPSNQTHAAEPSYVIKPFTAQLVEHEPSFTAEGKVVPGSLQVPPPNPVELSVSEGESILEKVKSKMPLVLEAKSRRRHFSSANHSSTRSPHPDGKVVNSVAPSSDFSLPPYPVTRLTTIKSDHSPIPTNRPPNAQVIRSLLQQLIEATREVHPVEAESVPTAQDSRQIYFDQQHLDTKTSYYELHFGREHEAVAAHVKESLPSPLVIQQPSYATLETMQNIQTSPQLVPLSSFVLESNGSPEPITLSDTTTESTWTTMFQQPPSMGKLFNHAFTYRDRQRSPSLDEQAENLDTTTFPNDVQTTTEIHQSGLLSTNSNPSTANNFGQELKTMHNLTVQLSGGPVSISNTYTGSRFFNASSLNHHDGESTNDTETVEEPKKEAFAEVLPIELGSKQFNSIVSESLKDAHLENPTYREKVVKIASLYIAELIANIMSLKHETKSVTENIQIKENVITKQAAKKEDGIEVNDSRPKLPEERKTFPTADSETAGLKSGTAEIETHIAADTSGAVMPTMNVTRVKKTAADLLAGRRVFVVEAKTSYVFPTDTPVPSNDEPQVHRQAYTVTVSGEDDDSYELISDYATPFQLMNGAT